MVSVPGSTRSSSVRVRRGAPDEHGGCSSGLGRWSAGVPLSGVLHPWARAGSLRFPGDPSYAFALFQDPGRAGRTSPMTVLSTPPPVYPNRRPQRVHNLEADAGLQHPLSTLHERRCRRPCKTRFRLAGCASTGRGSNPLDHDERFQVTSPFSSPGLTLTQGRCTPTRSASWPTFGNRPRPASSASECARSVGRRVELDYSAIAIPCASKR